MSVSGEMVNFGYFSESALIGYANQSKFDFPTQARKHEGDESRIHRMTL
jgi:hypothetical protein